LAVKIRLRRVGAKKQPSYRVVVADSRAPGDGRYIENIGWYNPLTDPSTIRIDAERAAYWLGVGAQPSDSVQSLFRRSGVVTGAAAQPAPAATTPTRTAATQALDTPTPPADQDVTSGMPASEE
jgi:small subunit ribosomal protein S16